MISLGGLSHVSAQCGGVGVALEVTWRI